ncbi:hypothetical protein [Mesorhizobium sp. B2-8-5]|uniref:hypothetical protein n=1 Tax=Mesorhizobium sp. B2-8-5 TaxID=2589903 RepID=UPI00112CC4EC|nr:hypothetical protein [Mesorhizobium sp. B2-8-5]UCI24001.1 hypothetical protein FJ430_20605 [Mesorhizobium sp. B2-8-5]
MIAIIGIGCFCMAFVLFAVDPLEYNPDPDLQALVWAGFGIWCFVTAWQQRDRRPPSDKS